MTSHEVDRHVTARDITGSNVVTGSHNNVTNRTIQHFPPSSETVNARAELASLRELLDRLNTPERGKLDRALDDACEEVEKPNPDKEEAAGALSRVVKYAKAANDFGELAEKWGSHISALAAWLGGPHATTLLTMAGLG